MSSLTVLGTTAALPLPGRTNTSLLLRLDTPGGGARILFDCGPGVLHQLNDVGLSPGRVDALLLSHIHGDHSLGFPMLVLARFIKKDAPLNVYCPRSSAEDLRTLVRIVYPDLFPAMAEFFEIRPLADDAPDSADLPGDIAIRSFPTTHGVPSFGLRVERGGESVVYSGDTGPTPGFEEFAAGAGILVHESTFSETLDPGKGAPHHSNAKYAGEVAGKAGVKMLVLAHVHEKYAGLEETLEKEAAASYRGPIFVPVRPTTFSIG